MGSVMPGRGSKLAPHASALLQLRAAGYTISQVVQYLAQVGVSSSRSNVHAYLARLLRDATPGRQGEPLARAGEALPPTQVAHAPAPPLPINPPSPVAPSPESPERLSIRAIRDKHRNMRELAEYARKHMPPNI
ncbi:hypothetical protein AACH06_25730 [Ideonella sp. DXS29W]|uniref:KfrA N-terminal DNA-binding domain-containing protein n=1 Tax=Ideonella lacteola TaxID=2984193 RepID=A0ABU9BW90_9BURK